MGENIPGGDFLGGKFPGGGVIFQAKFDGWEFSRGEFS